MARIAKIAGRVFARGWEVVAVAPILSSMFGDSANHQRRQQKRQIDDAYLEQVAGYHAALVFAGGAQDASKANRVGEIKQSKRGRGKCVHRSGHAEPPGSEAYGNHDHGVEKG